MQSAVESAANIGGQVGAVGRRSYRRGTGLAEGELGSEARRPSDRGHADPGSHRAVHPGPTADGTRGRSASLGRRGILWRCLSRLSRLGARRWPIWRHDW